MSQKYFGKYRGVVINNVDPMQMGCILAQVKEPIRRPPANMAAFTMGQHLLSHGVIKIQIAEGPSFPGEYEVCRLKTIGWYAAQLVSSKG